MTHLVKRVFSERLEADLETESQNGWRLVSFTFIPHSSSELLVVYGRPSWECGCGTVNAEPFTICLVCHRSRP